MDSEKLELLEKIQQKGMSPAQVAEAMSFNPEVLSLYLVKDAYPVPKRILAQIAKVIGN
jgi:hypothetical protein